jgi:SAM-dependent methyltransferase
MQEQTELKLTQRQLNEKAHYDEAYQHHRVPGPDGKPTFPPAETAFHVVLGKETRPYNQDWEYLRYVKDLNLQGKTVLELGCGSGGYSVILASLGAKVVAIDLSAVGIEVARERARFYGFEDRIRFINQAAEALEFPDGMFDAVVGAYVLHHIEIELASQRLRKILKPGGTAVFLEWVAWSPFDSVRSNRFLSKLFPHGDGDVTEDERKLDDRDLSVLRNAFKAVDVIRFYTLARLHYFMPRTLPYLRKLDHWLYRHFPSIRNAGGAAIIRLTN